MKDQQFTMAEARLGANLLKDLRQISATDSEFARGVKRDIAKIDLALQSGDLEQMINCNRQTYATYGNMLLQNGYLYPTNEHSMRCQGLLANYLTICIIKMTLQKMVYWVKVDGARQVLVANGIHYLLEKAVVALVCPQNN